MLFRSEVLAHRADRLSGSVAIAVPAAWQAIGYLLFTGVAAGFAFIAVAPYARVETVAGAIVPDAGVSAIVPTRSGVITSVAVREGQLVPAGADLAAIRAEEDGVGGVSAASRLEAAIAQQDVSLGVQAGAAQAAAGAQLNQLAAQRTGLKAEISQIQSQIVFQQGLVASATKDVERARTLSAQGFVSPRELQNREEGLLSRQQTLAQLQQLLEGRKSALVEAENAAGQVSAQARAQVASLAASRAEVAQLAASTNGSRAYVLRAPIAGRVAALTARVGSPASAQVSLMTIVPDGSVLRAELAVPSAAIGFTKPAQDVRLAIDAFPYQRFGTVRGRILTVASSSISRSDANGRVISVYPVRVALADDHVAAFGRREALVPGMTLTARIITEKQSLFEWLFEPLFAVRRR
jgi:membrane fusion protein